MHRVGRRTHRGDGSARARRRRGRHPHGRPTRRPRPALALQLDPGLDRRLEALTTLLNLGRTAETHVADGPAAALEQWVVTRDIGTLMEQHRHLLLGSRLDAG